MLTIELYIVGTPLFITKDRIKIIEYLSMTTPTTSGFLFREPPLSYVTNIYSMPFNMIVWVTSGTIVTIATFIISITFKLQYQLNKLDRDENEDQLRISDVILLSIAAACQMGSTLQPRIISARISTVKFSKKFWEISFL